MIYNSPLASRIRSISRSIFFSIYFSLSLVAQLNLYSHCIDMTRIFFLSFVRFLFIITSNKNLNLFHQTIEDTKKHKLAIYLCFCFCCCCCRCCCSTFCPLGKFVLSFSNLIRYESYRLTDHCFVLSFISFVPLIFLFVFVVFFFSFFYEMSKGNRLRSKKGEERERKYIKQKSKIDSYIVSIVLLLLSSSLACLLDRNRERERKRICLLKKTFSLSLF